MRRLGCLITLIALFFATAGCVAQKGEIAVTSGFVPTRAQVKNISLSPDHKQIIITGSNLDIVKQVKIDTPIAHEFDIDTQTSTVIRLSPRSALTLSMNVLYNFLVVDANGAAAFSIDFSIEQMGANTGDFLQWNGTSWSPAPLTGPNQLGTWDALSNTPVINSGVGTAGDYYVVSVTGASLIDGTNTWNAGDWIYFDGALGQWVRIQNTNSVNSFNGRQGAILPASGDYSIDQISSTPGGYFTYKPNAVACADGEILKWNLALGRWDCAADAGANGTTDPNNQIIEADNDSSGGGEIQFQIGGTTEAVLTNAGDLQLGSSVGTGTGRSFTIGDSGSEASLVVGADFNNRFKLNWNPAGRYIGFGTRELGVDYNNTLMLKGGKVGIGTTSPADRLDVAGGIRVATATGTSEGTIQFVGGDLEVRKGGAWVSLTSQQAALDPTNITGTGVANRVAFFDSQNTISASGTVDLTELSYLDGATSNLQAQINSISVSDPTNITGTGVANRVAIFDSQNTITSSGTVDLTELGYLDGVTSNIQAQINSLPGADPDTVTGTGLANYVTFFTTQHTLSASGTIDTTELGYLDGVTSNIQAQINAINSADPSAISGTGVANYITFFDGTQTLSASGTIDTTELGYLDGVNQNIQTQIDSKIGAGSLIWTDTGAYTYYNGGQNVGIGLAMPGETLEVGGGIKVGSATGNADGTIHFDGTNFYVREGSAWKLITNVGAGGAGGAFSDSGAWAYYANKVGIAVLAPNEKLEVLGAIKVATAAGTAEGTIQFANGDLEVRKGGAWVSLTSGGVDPSSIIWTDTGAYAYYNGGQNVGVNTTTPGETFEVVGGIKVGSATGTADGTIHFDGGNFYVREGGSWKLITAGGVGGGTGAFSDDGAWAYYSNKVGIGVLAPNEKLEVVGGIKVATATGTAEGTIQFAGGDLEVRKGGAWVSLTYAGGTDPDAISGTGVANYVSFFDSTKTLSASGTVDTTELGYLDGATSNIQAQIDSKIGAGSLIWTDTGAYTYYNGGQNVGIGLTTPGETLEVGGGIKVGSATGTADGTIHFDGGNFYVREGGSWKLITTGGVGGGTGAFSDDGAWAYYSNKVGIGVLAPNEKLEVVGGIKVATAAGTAEGTIQFAGGDLEVRKGGAWVSLTYAGGTDPDAISGTGVANYVSFFDSTKTLSASGTIDTTELGYLDGATSNIQAQINAINSADPDAISGTGVANYIAFFDGTKTISASGTIDTTELGYLDGVNSNVQTQIDSKIGAGSLIWTDTGAYTYYNGGQNVGINTATPGETLEVVGGIKVGSATGTAEGTIHFDGANFYVREGGAWKLITTGGVGGGTGAFSDDGAWAYYSNKVGIGVLAPNERLELLGAIKVATAAGTAEGTIQFAGGDLQVRKGGAWVSLTAGGGTDPDAISGTGVANYVSFFDSTKTLSASGTIDTTELGYLDGATSNIQAQINAINSADPDAISGTGIANYIAFFDGTKTISASGTIDVTELGYLDGVTSNVQTQIDSKIGAGSLIWTDTGAYTYYNGGQNVGIGLTTPGETLEVVGGIKVGSATGTADGTIHFDGGNFYVREGGSWKLITAGGVGGGTGAFSDDGAWAYYSNKVGIGVLAPNEKLEVVGGIKVATAAGTAEGTIQFAGGDLEVRKGGAWVSLTAGGGTDPDAISGTGVANYIAFFDGTKTISSSGTIDTTELGYLDGVTSNIQTQLDSKISADPDAISGTGVANFVAFFDGTNTISSSGTIDTTELGYLDGVNQNIQTQIDSKIGAGSLIWTDTGAYTYYNGGQNVGIGLTTPGETLEVVGGIKVGSATGTADGTIHFDGGNFYVREGGSWKLITAGGVGGGTGAFSDDGAWAYYSNKVGIGVLAPNEKLEVVGGIKVATAAGTAEGTIQFAGGDLEVRKGGAWVSLTAGGGTDPDAISGTGVANFVAFFDGTKTISSSGTIDTTELGHLDGVNQNIQAQIDTKIGAGSLIWTDTGAYTYYNGGQNVGIGVTTPGEALEVNGALKIGAAAGTANGTLHFNGSQFYAREGGVWKSITSGGGSGGAFTDTGAYVYYNGGNNVGINNATPAETLHVGGGIRVGSATGTADGTIHFDGGNFYVREGGSWKLITAGGVGGGTGAFSDDGAWAYYSNKVGIGVLAPSEKLEVVGGIKVATASGTAEGTIQFANGDLEVRKGGAWVSLTSGGGGGSGGAFTDTGSYVYYDGGNNVGIGTSAPEADAILDLSSTGKGFLPPRLTTAQRDAIGTPSTGLMLFNTSTGSLNVFNGTSWNEVAVASTVLQPVTVNRDGDGNQSLSADTWTTVDFSTETEDTWGQYDTGADIFTASQTGRFLIIGSVATDTSSTGEMSVELYLNGTTTISTGVTVGSDVSQVNTSKTAIVYTLTAGDTVELRAKCFDACNVLDHLDKTYFQVIPMTAGSGGGGGGGAPGPDSITSVEIANNAVGSSEITDGSVTLADVDFSSTTSALGLPTMSEADRNNIASPSLGDIIFNSTTGKLNAYTSSGWSDASPTTFWTDTGTYTYVTTTNNVGIGTPTPVAKLEVAGGIKVGNDSDACTATKGGTTRYLASTGEMQYCNGIKLAWMNMGGGDRIAVKTLAERPIGYCDGGSNDGAMWTLDTELGVMYFCKNSKLYTLKEAKATNISYTSAYMFLSTATVTGAFGLANMDANCQTEADAGSLTSPLGITNWKAMVGASTRTSMRLPLDPNLIDATISAYVAQTGWASAGDTSELFNTFADTLNVSYDANGTDLGTGLNVWTGATAGGVYDAGQNCSDWGSTAGNGNVGNTTYTLDDATQRWQASGSSACTNQNRYICGGYREMFKSFYGVPASQSIFVTSMTFLGSDMETLESADLTCNSMADHGSQTSSITRPWRAVLSTLLESAQERIKLYGDVTIIGSGGAKITKADFWTSASHGITWDQNGTNLGAVNVWTGSYGYGAHTGSSCTNWTDSAGNGQVGSTTGTSWDSGVSACTNEHHIYCISQ